MSSFFKIAMGLVAFVSLSFSETKNQTIQKNKDILTKEEHNYFKKNTSLSVAVVSSWKNVSFYNKKNKLVGFNIDLINQINKNLGINLSPKVFATWNEAFNSVKNTSTDSIMSLSWSKEREKYFRYSKAYSFYPHDLIVRKNNTDILSLKDLKYKRVGVNKNSITINALKRLSPLIEIIESEKEIDTLIKISKNELDAGFFGEVRQVILNKYNLKISKKVFIKEGNLYIGSSKKNKIISSIINKGLLSISREQMEIIKRKWSKVEQNKSIFTKEELTYIKNASKINVGITNWKPFLFVENEKILGPVGELLIKAFEFSGLEYSLHVNPRNEIMKSFKKGEVDLIPNAYYLKSREEFALFSEPYLNIKEYIYIKQNASKINGFKDLQNKRVAIVKGYTSIKQLQKLYKNIKIIESVDVEDSIIKLLKNEVDALFDSQIAIEYKLKQLGIKDLLTIPQYDIKENSLHYLFQKNDSILRDILEKSLLSIPVHDKNAIISKLRNLAKIKEEVSIAFLSNNEPYTIGKEYLKGIEYDLLKKTLGKIGVKISRSKFFSQNNMKDVLINNDYIDIAAGVKEKQDNFHYSNDFISFQNVVVSRVKDNFFINKVKDLEEKKIIAFGDAYKYLGPRYNKKFNVSNRDLNYSEMFKYENMVKIFLNKEVDLIILDKNIFSWYLKKLSGNSINDYKFDYIFPEKNSFKVAFRSENLRNIFNDKLKIIKENGEYKEVFFDYIKSNIYGKIQVNTLLSSLVSKSIFDSNLKEVERIITLFSKLPFINKIEVFDSEEDKMIFSSSKKILKNFLQQDSYYLNNGIPTKVAYLKVYFNEAELKKYTTSDLIPPLHRFFNFDSFIYINNIYKDYNYINKKVFFSLEEKNYIKNNPNIYFSQTILNPFFSYTNSVYTGLFSHYIKIIEEKTKLNFKFIKTENYTTPEKTNNFF